MDIRSFRHSPTGRLVAGDDFWAFVPNPLPPQLAQDMELSQHIAAASQVVTDLARLSQTLLEPQTLVRPFIRREAVFSCRLAGTQVDLMDLYACQADRLAWPDTIARTREDDLRTVLHYADTLEHGLRRVPSAPVNLRFMRELHAQLYQRQTPNEFRMVQNWIGPPGGLTEATYVPPPVAEMQLALRDLESYLASTTEPKHHPLVRLAFIHYQLEAIHPFMDGNGRVGRLLILILLRQWGLLPHPSLPMSVHFERHQQAYDDHLLAVSRDGDWRAWVLFFLRGVEGQARDAIRRTKALRDVHDTYRARLAHSRPGEGQPRSLGPIRKLVDVLFDTPILTVPGLQDVLEMSLPNAQRTVQHLVDTGILTPYSMTEGTSRQGGDSQSTEAVHHSAYMAMDVLNAIVL